MKISTLLKHITPDFVINVHIAFITRLKMENDTISTHDLVINNHIYKSLFFYFLGLVQKGCSNSFA